MPELCSFAPRFPDRRGRDRSRGQGIWKRLQTGAFLACLLAAGCGTRTDPPPPNAFEELPPIVLDSLHFSGYRGATQDIEVRARQADLRPDQQVAELRGVDIRFRNSERGPMHVTADRGDFNLATQAFVLHENVKGEVGDDQRFATSEVRYDEKKRRLHTSRPVQIENGRISFQGKGMVVDVESGLLTLNDPSGATK
jgi:LPS export ABC transporter protein LptC